jgi:hypothetical protein
MNEERYLIEEGDDRLVATAATYGAARVAARENIEPEGCRDSVLTIRRAGTETTLARAKWNERDGCVTYHTSTLTKGLV